MKLNLIPVSSLKKQFPHISGLQHTILAKTDTWEIITAEGIQILNDLNKHWVHREHSECL